MDTPPPIAVISCFVTPSPTTRQATGVEIDYVNTGTVTLHNVTFSVKYHTIDADIRRDVSDTGTFAPGVHIAHHFDEFAGQSYIMGSPTVCTAESGN